MRAPHSRKRWLSHLVKGHSAGREENLSIGIENTLDARRPRNEYLQLTSDCTAASRRPRGHSQPSQKPRRGRDCSQLKHVRPTGECVSALAIARVRWHRATMLLRGDDHASLEITNSAEGPSSWGGRSDVRLFVAVSARGFSGTANVWVLGEVWTSFLKGLEVLDRTRSGVATVESMSPDELVLTFRIVDRAGHVAFACTLGRRLASGTAVLRISDVRFDPTEIPTVVRGLKTL